VGLEDEDSLPGLDYLEEVQGKTEEVQQVSFSHFKTRPFLKYYFIFVFSNLS